MDQKQNVQKQITIQDIVNYLNKEIPVIRKKLQDLELYTMNLRTDIDRINSFLKYQVPVREMKVPVHLTKAQKLLLEYCEIPRKYSEIKEYMHQHGYTMGANFEKLKEMKLIAKEGHGWYKVKESQEWGMYKKVD